METQTTDAWLGEPTPAAARLAEIRRAAERVHPDAVAQCLPAMLRDLQAENDRLIEAARVQRAETLCEVAELLARLDQMAAAEFVNAQVLLEWVGNGHVPMSADIHTRLLTRLADFQKSNGAALFTAGATTCLVVDPALDAAVASQDLVDIVFSRRPREA